MSRARWISTFPAASSCRSTTSTLRSIRAPHPFEAANRAAIDANWLHEKAANPALFDGEVSLLARLAYRDGRLEGACHAVRYATFLYWRKTRPWPGAEHAFAHAMPVTSDGALIAIRMGARYRQSGQGLLRRRLVRAGGFSRRQGRRRSQHGARGGGGDRARHRRPAARPALPRAVGRQRHGHLPPLFPAEASRRKIADAHPRLRRAREPEPEIEEPVIIRNADDLPDGVMPYMATLIAWHFSRGAGAV